MQKLAFIQSTLIGKERWKVGCWKKSVFLPFDRWTGKETGRKLTYFSQMYSINDRLNYRKFKIVRILKFCDHIWNQHKNASKWVKTSLGLVHGSLGSPVTFSSQWNHKFKAWRVLIIADNQMKKVCALKNCSEISIFLNMEKKSMANVTYHQVPERKNQSSMAHNQSCV